MLDVNSVAMPTALAREFHDVLVRADGQEDLTFALWHPSEGTHRRTALLRKRLAPLPDDREIHGNVSFNPSYLERALQAALHGGAGLAFLHSHPFPGWQYMSDDDIAAEKRIARAACALTTLPLIGLTTGSDGTWSARAWAATPECPEPQVKWLPEIRNVGDALRVSRSPGAERPRRRAATLVRTVAAWGDHAQADLERLHVGIVGLGSVGSMVAESLARMGLQRLTLIDFDTVELKNLDRLVAATEADVGRRKTDVTAERVKRVGTAPSLDVVTVSEKVSHPQAYRAALDCDILFSCVDRPHPRHVLNFMAFSHLVPVIDGGILVRNRSGVFRGADWQVQTVAPGRVCLCCLGAYDSNAVSLDHAGLLDDPSYLAGLDPASPLHRRENVFPFGANLASLEVFHLIAFVTAIAGQADLGVQRFRYYPGVMDQRVGLACRAGCEFVGLTATGDRYFSLMDTASAALDSVA